MSGDAPLPTIFEGRCVHKASNALQITFHDGPDEPFAVGVQGAGDSRGKRLGILFGFKNGGPGNHLVTYRDGSVLGVSSRDLAPTVLTRDGVEIATVEDLYRDRRMPYTAGLLGSVAAGSLRAAR